MPDVFRHELESYQRAIDDLSNEIGSLLSDRSVNLTHASLSISNRQNFMVVGLCSLVEVKLYELAVDIGLTPKAAIRWNELKDLVFSFDHLNRSDDFEKLRTIRHAIVHGYGGIAPCRCTPQVPEAAKQLCIEWILLMQSRIRFDVEALQIVHKLVSDLMREIESAAQRTLAPSI